MVNCQENEAPAVTIQEDGSVSEIEHFIKNENLTEDQIKLLMEISEQFSVEDNAADLSILYEVTGFRAESENFQYWDNYADFEELGETKLTREDRDEKILASSRNKTRKAVVFENEALLSRQDTDDT